MNISQRLNRLPASPLLIKVVIIAGLGLMFDAMDQGIVAGVMASITEEWALTDLQRSLLGSSGILGMLLGALVAGIAADRWGRRTIVLVTLLIFSCGSLLCGLSPGYEWLLVFRFITGIGLGGELPVITTYVSEFSSLKNRGRNVVFVESFWAWGWILAALVALIFIPAFSWRAAFFVGALPAFFAAALRFLIPESPRYLEQRGRLAEAEAIVSKMERSVGVEPPVNGALPSTDVSAFGASTAEAGSQVNETSSQKSEQSSSPPQKLSPFECFVKLWSREYRQSTIVLWVLWFGINLGYYGFVLWTPSFLMAQGFEMVRSFEFTLYMSLAQLPGYLAAALLIEKIGRKRVLTHFLLGTACAAWLFGHASSEPFVLFSGCLLYFFALGAWGCVYSYTPELYPTTIRTTGAGAASAFGRVGAFIAPMLVPFMYGQFGSEHGFQLVFVLLTAVFVVVAVVIGIFGKETKGRVIPEIGQ